MQKLNKKANIAKKKERSKCKQTWKSCSYEATWWFKTPKMLLAYDGLQAYSITLQVPFCNSICIEPYVLLTSLPLPATILLPHQRPKTISCWQSHPNKKTHAHRSKLAFLATWWGCCHVGWHPKPGPVAPLGWRTAVSRVLQPSWMQDAQATENHFGAGEGGPSKTIPSI